MLIASCPGPAGRTHIVVMEVEMEAIVAFQEAQKKLRVPVKPHDGNNPKNDGGKEGAGKGGDPKEERVLRARTRPPPPVASRRGGLQISIAFLVPLD